MILGSRFFLFFILAAAFPASAADVDVLPGGLGEAIVKSSPGDRLILSTGIYTERVRVNKPLTLVAAGDGVIMEGSIPLGGEWQPAGRDLADVWMTAIESRPRGLLVDGKFVAEIRHSAAQTKGEWHWRTLLQRGPPLSGFDQVRALWIYHPEERRIYARFEGAAAPNQLKLSVLESAEPLIKVSAANVVLEGMTLRGASVAISLESGASDCEVRRCHVASYESTGILLTNGAERCTVTECGITRGALEEWKPSLEHSRPNYEIWRIHKDVGNKDRPGIQLIRAGANNRILRNRLDRVFDGICLGDYKAESLSAPAADPEHGRAAEIAHNMIENTRDSGIELGVGCVGVQVHHNVLRQTHGGLRFKVPRVGPVFIHHNRLIDGAPFNIWFSMDSSPAEGYVYHNTIVGGDSAGVVLSLKGSKSSFSAPKWHFVNNLVLSDEGFFDQYGETPPVDFKASHNVTTGGRQPWPKAMERDRGSRYEVEISHDAEGRPAPGSAAANAGIDLSTYRNGKPLPGCEPGYFKGGAPDPGADEVE